MSLTLSLPFAPIVGTGLHLELDSEVTLRDFGMLAVHGGSGISQITCFHNCFYGLFLALLSFFGAGSPIQHESPNTGGLGLVVPNVHRRGQGGKTEKAFLLLRCYGLKFSACSYDKYIMRYKFLNNFEGFSSRSCHPDCGR